MDPQPAGSLEEQVSELRSQMRRLEQTLQSYGIVLQGKEAAPQPNDPGRTQAEPPYRPPRPITERQIESPQRPEFSYPDTPRDDRSLENRIGSQWFNRIGILAVLIGTAWFLKLAIDNHWIGPLGRVLIGLVSGAWLIAWSERFRNRGYPAFAYSLKAVGSGVLYLSLWAAFSLFHLIPAGVAFAAMILVTAFNGFLAWLQDTELLALYAIAGGLSTPLLVSTGGNHEITLFSYLLTLDIAVLVLVALRPWSRLLFGSFVGTVLLFAGWWFAYHSDTQTAITAFFLSCFFLIFAFAPRLVRMNSADQPSFAWDELMLILLPIANAGLGFVTFYALFDPSGTQWSGAWLAIAFAAFYLLLLRLPAGERLHESPALLSALHFALAIVFLIVAIPLKAHGRWLTVGWLGEGAALLWAASRVHSLLLRAFALLCLTLGLIALVAGNPAASTTPFLNQRFAAYCVGIAVFAFAVWIARKAQAEGNRRGSIPWSSLAAIAVLVVNVLILLAIGWEIHSYWWFLRWHGGIHLLRGYGMYAQFSYSALFMVFGAVLLGVGFWRRSAFLRWQALVLLAVAIAKVFLVDMSELSQGYRIVSFLGLGALLLAVSFAYQRDWLNLRVQGGRAL